MRPTAMPTSHDVNTIFMPVTLAPAPTGGHRVDAGRFLGPHKVLPLGFEPRLRRF